ncbi:MAG TPA: hypothetical protein VK277_02935 [Acidimicrobiales bacterium]|nr:hypothetical protein [Acidimicrobiales bacterium]
MRRARHRDHVARRLLVGTLAMGLLAALVSGAGVPAGATGTTVVTVVGTGRPAFGGDGGPAARASLDGPEGIAVDGAGDLFIADTGNCRVREVPAHSGVQYGISMDAHRIYTVAGGTCAGVKSTLTRTDIGFPTGVAVDRYGDLFIALATANRVVVLAAKAAKSQAPQSFLGDGTAGDAEISVTAPFGQLRQPSGVAVDPSDDVFVADTGNCRVLEVRGSGGPTRVDTTAPYEVVAGTGTCGASGDGGPASSAELGPPTAVAVDGSGNLYIADRGNSTVRVVAAVSGTYFGVPIAAGDIATVAGDGGYGPYLTDGLPATSPVGELNFPYGLAVDARGDLFVADTYSRAVRFVAAGTGSVFGRSVQSNAMYTLVGAVPTGSQSDGTKWVLSTITYPSGVAVDQAGDVYFSDQGANVVREVRAGSGEEASGTG